MLSNTSRSGARIRAPRFLLLLLAACFAMAASGARPPRPLSAGSLEPRLSEGPAASPLQGAPQVIPIRASFTSVQWEGWGTTLGWWANFAGTYPEEEHAELLDLLFDSNTGLGLNIARYNIGAGFNASIDPQFTSEPLAFMATPGFRAAPGAPYDWSAGAAQRRVLAGARRRGVSVLEAIAFSPPWWMTVSGSVAGGYYKGAENLNPFFRDAFAEYLTDIIAHFGRELGVPFASLAPFNEPVEDWWVAGGKKEGCSVSPGGISEVLAGAAARLASRRLATRVSAADAWLSDTARMLANLSAAALAAVSRINVHSYLCSPHEGGPGHPRTEVRKLAAALGKPVWVSEIGPQDLPFADELDTALEMAAYVARDINELQATAWVYWQALEQKNVGAGWYWGLLQLEGDFNTSEPLRFIIMKQYYMLMHFTRWFRPGCRFVTLQPELQDAVLAAWDPSSARLSVVLINPSPAADTVLLKLEGFTSSGPVALSCYLTSSADDHRLVGGQTFASRPETLAVTRAARSMQTLVLDGVLLQGAAPGRDLSAGGDAVA